VRARTLGQLALMTLICLIIFWPLGAWITGTYYSGPGEPGYEGYVAAQRIFWLIWAILLALTIAFSITALVTYVFELRARARNLEQTGCCLPESP